MCWWNYHILKIYVKTKFYHSEDNELETQNEDVNLKNTRYELKNN